MAEVVQLDDLTPAGATTARFDGSRHGCATSFFAVVAAPGQGPALHRHTYTETFIVHDGQAVFTVGGEQLAADAGAVVVVAPDESHRFEAKGPAMLRMVAVHDAPDIVTEWL